MSFTELLFSSLMILAFEPSAKEQKEKTFRIDRMDKTVLSRRKACKIPFNVDKCIDRYQSSIFCMFSGRKIIAEFEFDFIAMNIIYDKFGEKTKITKIDDDRYYAKLPIENSPTFWGWFFMLGKRIHILSPASLITEYANRLDCVKKDGYHWYESKN